MAYLRCIASLIVFGTLLVKSAPAETRQITVGDLYKFCTSSNDSDKAACTFYILGVFEGAQLGGATAQDKGGDFREAKNKRFCVPEGLKSSAMELTIKMKMGADLAVFPQDREMPAVSFITAVIAQQFPCQNPK
jgi:hypothetical protein